jgi:catechol 2,3-dioxygenase
MISGGNVTVFVSSMDNAVHFYTEVLGLKLTNRFGDHWATVTAGNGLIIGLHPATPNYPAPGTKGSMMLGFEVDEAMEIVAARLSERGVRFTGSITRDDPGRFVNLEDPDGNGIYLWETNRGTVPETDWAHTGTGVGTSVT